MKYLFRIAEKKDAQQMLEIYAPFIEDSWVSFEYEVPSAEEFAGRIEKINSFYPWIVCEAAERIAGYAYASGHRDRTAYRWTCEVSVYVHPEFRNRGLAGALYGSLHQLLRAQGFVNAYAGIGLPNDASVKAHESAGYRRFADYPSVGFKCGKWIDTAWWRFQLQPPPVDPQFPRSISEISRQELVKILREGAARVRETAAVK